MEEFAKRHGYSQEDLDKMDDKEIAELSQELFNRLPRPDNATRYAKENGFLHSPIPDTDKDALDLEIERIIQENKDYNAKQPRHKWRSIKPKVVRRILRNSNEIVSGEVREPAHEEMVS